MIKIKVSGYEFTYHGNISIRIDDVFVHISANGYINDNSLKYVIDNKVDDTFLTKDVENIEGFNG